MYQYGPIQLVGGCTKTLRVEQHTTEMNLINPLTPLSMPHTIIRTALIKSNYIGRIDIFSRCYCGCSEMFVFLATIIHIYKSKRMELRKTEILGRAM
jgi:hypothetical protein